MRENQFEMMSARDLRNRPDMWRTRATESSNVEEYPASDLLVASHDMRRAWNFDPRRSEGERSLDLSCVRTCYIQVMSGVLDMANKQSKVCIGVQSSTK